MANTTYGAIKLATANDVGTVLKKKMGSQTGFSPKEWADTINLLGKLPTRTVTGTIAHFEDGADDVPIVEGIFAFNPIQTGTGDPSPSNPRPITGFTGLNVTQTGKNMFNPATILKGSYDSSTNTWSNISGSQVKAFEFDFKPNTQYTFSGIETQSEANKNARLVIRYTDGTNDNLFATNDTTPQAFVKTSESGKSISFVYYGYGTGSTNGVSVQNFQIEVGTSSSDFEQYTGHIYPISWTSEGTKYGGTYNSKTGVLRVTHSVVDLGSLTWTYRTDVLSVPCFLSNNINDLKSGSIPLLCEKLKIMEPNRTAINGNYQIAIGNNTNAQYLVIRYDEYTSGDDVSAALTGCKLIYELATPIEIQLEPTEMVTLLGVNNFYHDGNGDSTIEYRADIDILINELGG